MSVSSTSLDPASTAVLSPSVVSGGDAIPPASPPVSAPPSGDAGSGTSGVGQPGPVVDQVERDARRLTETILAFADLELVGPVNLSNLSDTVLFAPSVWWVKAARLAGVDVPVSSAVICRVAVLVADAARSESGGRS